MLKRSLTFKIYVYAVVAFAMLALGSQAVFDALMRDHESAFFEERVAPQVAFLASELAAAGPETPAGRQRLAALQRGMSVRLSYFPWTDQTGIPPALRTQPRATTPGRRSGPFGRHYWARIDQDGKPIGALRVRFRPPYQLYWRRRTFGYGAIMAVLAVVLIPPLLYWVIRPIRRLEAAVHRLAAGDLDTPVVFSRQDELGRLAAAFDTMRQQVRLMLHEKERLLTDVSHELRGPLTRMALAQDMLEEDHGNNAYVARLRSELGHLDTLTGELLSLSRNRQDVPMVQAAVDVAAVVATLVAERDLLAQQSGITVKTDLAPAATVGNMEQLRRAFGNLLDNALKYTPSGGVITVATSQTADSAVVTVRDTGIGISADALPHVFEPFYRPDAARSRETGGTGLGLAIVKAIVDRHRGTVTLSSGPARGTLATVSLPLTAG